MAVGDRTPGRRRDWGSTRPWEPEPGDYMYQQREDGTVGVWVWTPGSPGHGPCELSIWSLKEAAARCVVGSLDDVGWRPTTATRRAGFEGSCAPAATRLWGSWETRVRLFCEFCST